MQQQHQLLSIMTSYISELSQPTAIHNSIACHFTSLNANNIIVQRGNNIIELYEIEGTTNKLQRVGEYKLFGRICDIGILHHTQYAADILCISCSESIVSCMVWNNDTYGLQTIYSNQWDDKRGQLANTFNLQHIPQLCIDPNNQCIVMQIYVTHLAVVPIRMYHTRDKIDCNNSIFGTPYLINLQSLGICNYRGIQFLYGYSDPTILIMYDESITSVGRYAANKHSVALKCVSLNLLRESCVELCYVNSLAHDCQVLVPCPLPIGGVLIISCNLIYHFNNHIIDYVLSLNEFGDRDTIFHIDKSSLVTKLDTVQCVFISGTTALLNDSVGRIYELNVLSIGTFVRSIQLQYIGDLCPPTCMSSIQYNTDTGYIFIGSNIGHSYLLQYTKQSNKIMGTVHGDDTMNNYEKIENDSVTDKLDDIIMKKLSAINTMKHELNNNIDHESSSQLDDTEYTYHIPTKTRSSTHSIVVVDMFVCSSPIADSLVTTQCKPTLRVVSDDDIDNDIFDTTQPTNINDKHNNTNKLIQVVSCVGYGRASSITIVTEAIQPDILYTTTLHELNIPGGIQQMYNIQYNNDQLLVLSSTDSTSILSVSNNTIQSIDTNDQPFNMDVHTVCVGTVLDNVIVQVYSNIVLLMHSNKQTKYKLNQSIVSSQIHSPYIICHTTELDIICLTISFNNKNRVHVTDNIIHDPPFNSSTAYTVFHDINQQFQFDGAAQPSEQHRMNGTHTHDDVDELELLMLQHKQDHGMDIDTHSTATSTLNTSVHQYILLVCTGCTFYIYSLPTFKLLFRHNELSAGYSNIYNQLNKQPLLHQSSSTQSNTQSQVDLPLITQIIVTRLNTPNQAHIIFTTSSNDIVVYTTYTHHTTNTTALHRIDHTIPTRLLSDSNITRKLVRLVDTDYNEFVLVTGKHPYVISTQRNTVRTHTIHFTHDATNHSKTDNSMMSDTNHTINSSHQQCHIIDFVLDKHSGSNPHQIIAIDSNAVLYLCTIPALYSNTQLLSTSLYDYTVQLDTLSAYSYDQHMFKQYIHIGRTIRFITKHNGSNTYVLVISDSKPMESMEETTNRSIPVSVDQHSVLFIDCVSHAECGVYDELDEYEYITCCKSMILGGTKLTYNKPPTSQNEYIIIGTMPIQGDDVFCKGKLIVLTMYYKYGILNDGSESILLKHKPYVLHDKAGITQIHCVDGLLLSCVGSKLVLYDFIQNELIGRAFIESPYYIHTVDVLKNYIVYSDIVRGVTLCVWNKLIRQLIIIGRSNTIYQSTCVTLSIYDNSLNILVCDIYQNIQLLRYQPVKLSTQSQPVHIMTNSLQLHYHNGVLPLQIKSDYYCGTVVQSAMKLLQQSTYDTIPVDLLSDEQQSRLVEIDHDNQLAYIQTSINTFNVFSTLDGSYYSICSIDDSIYRRLQSLNTAITYTVSQYAQLNPRTYWLYKGRGQLHLQNKKCIVDHTLLQQYIQYDLYTQYRLARQIGSTRDTILDNIASIQWSTKLSV